MRIIDADAVADELEAIGARLPGSGQRMTLRIIANGLRHDKSLAPTIDPASLRPKGEWLGSGDGFDPDGNMVFDMWECSECCYYIDTDEPDTLPNFCPNCGADMRRAEVVAPYDGERAGQCPAPTEEESK